MRPLRWRGLAPRDAVGDNDHMRWVARADLGTLGIPAPVRTLLDAQFRIDEEEPR
jgi:A/G-specific adenine glycosylase